MARFTIETYGVLGIVLAHLPDGAEATTTTTSGHDGRIAVSFGDEDVAAAMAGALGLAGPLRRTSAYEDRTVHHAEWAGTVAGHEVQISAVRFEDQPETPKPTAEEA